MIDDFLFLGKSRSFKAFSNSKDLDLNVGDKEDTNKISKILRITIVFNETIKYKKISEVSHTVRESNLKFLNKLSLLKHGQNSQSVLCSYACLLSRLFSHVQDAESVSKIPGHEVACPFVCLSVREIWFVNLEQFIGFQLAICVMMSYSVCLQCMLVLVQ